MNQILRYGGPWHGPRVCEPDNSSDLTPSSYLREAITGADSAVSNGVPLEKVFDDLVATTRDRAPTCTSLIFLFEDRLVNRELKPVPCGPTCTTDTLFSFSLAYSPTRMVVVGSGAPKWPVRSVEAFSTFERKTLSNRILVIGNSVSHRDRLYCYRSTPSLH